MRCKFNENEIVNMNIEYWNDIVFISVNVSTKNLSALLYSSDKVQNGNMQIY